MLSNYHTHTPRCMHAVGAEWEYAERAVEGKLRVLGFSDHTPYFFPGGYRSSFRMLPGELDGYVETVLALREEYRGRLEIHLGLEAEYYPKYFARLLEALQAQPIEYLLLGQHYMGNEIEGQYSSAPTQDVKVLDRYCSQTIEAMQTGLFTYFAHPDLIHFVGDEGAYQRQIRRLCRAANACGVPLEINLLGLGQGRHYPDLRFWRIAGEEGCRAILGSDAHSPAAVWVPQVEQAALALAQECGLQLLEKAPLRPLAARG